MGNAISFFIIVTVCLVTRVRTHALVLMCSYLCTHTRVNVFVFMYVNTYLFTHVNAHLSIYHHTYHIKFKCDDIRSEMSQEEIIYDNFKGACKVPRGLVA